MENNSFIVLLEKASKDDYAMLEVLELAKPTINSVSIVNQKIDEDLRSELTAYLIELLRRDDFYKIIKNYKI